MGDLFQIKAKFSDRILIPDRAIPHGLRDGDYVLTLDGVKCMAHFLSTWDNGGGRYDDDLNGLCERQWNVPFRMIRSTWIGRIDDIGDIWHYMELKRIKNED